MYNVIFAHLCFFFPHINSTSGAHIIAHISLRGAYHRAFHSSGKFLDAHITLPGSRISLRRMSLMFRLVPVCTNWL